MMARRAKNPNTATTTPVTCEADPAPADQEPPAPPEDYRLTAEREAELLAEGRALGDDLQMFPGKTARRVIWYSRIQLAAERDAADLVKTPFPDDEPPLTLGEIHGMRDKIELFRITQSRWSAVFRTQHEAIVKFERVGEEAGRYRQTLLRFFDLGLRNDPEGQRRLSAIRQGRGDADLVQDVSDILVLCGAHAGAVATAPRGEAQAMARLIEMSPMLSRLLADKTLTPEAREARKVRDAAYTLVFRVERRIRAAAEYWYSGTDKLKPYAPFPLTSSTGGEDEGEAGDATDVEPPPPPASDVASPPPA